MAEKHVPVLIVGAGVVGLTASLVLSSYQIPHVIIERRKGPSDLPRFRGLNTRATEVLRVLGVDEVVRAAGVEIALSKGFHRGKSLLEVVEATKRNLDPKKGAMPFGAYLDGVVSPVNGLRCTHAQMEPTMMRIVQERGGELRLHTSCEDIKQDEKGVTATLLDRENGTTSVIHADYLIAADGAKSPIRRQLAIPMTGKGVIAHMINIYFHADLTELVKGREFSICEIDRPEVHGLFASSNNRDQWNFHLIYNPEKGEQASDFPRERCEDLMRLAIGVPDLKIEIKYMLPWEPSDNAVLRMKEGRVFLAGDAAHQVTPYGGQGATTGISDVFDLGWKLAAVFKGQADEKLLESYNTERQPVGQFVAHESGAVADERGLPQMTRGFLAILTTILPRIAMYSGFGYRYKSGAIVPEPEPSRWLWWWSVPWTINSLILGLNGTPGTRAPHIWVQHDGKRISTLDTFGKKFNLLAGSAGQRWCEAASSVATKLGVDLNAYRVGPAGELSSPDCQWDTAAGVTSRGALLVRPDGFVAWRAKDQDGSPEQRLEKALNQILFR